MKHSFHYGNIFKGREILDAASLQSIFCLEEGEMVEPWKLGDILAPKVPELRDKLGGEIVLSPIDYAMGKQYLDVFVIEKNDSQKGRQFRNKVDLPEELRELWCSYMELQQKLILEEKEFTQSNEDGHWISSEAGLSSIEEKFIELSSKYEEEIMEVLKASNDSQARAAAGYILHWGDNKEKIFTLLSEVLESDPDHGVHNMVLRALVAMMSNNVDDRRLEVVGGLLYHPSTACMNKALFFFLEVIKNKKLDPKKLMNSKYWKRIVSLSKAKQPNIGEVATEIMEVTK